MRNIYDTTQEPLYSHTSAGHNSDYYYANNGDIKPMLVNRQANRCYKCSNLFMNPEEAMLSYKIPLQYGGKNEPHNLVAVCLRVVNFCELAITGSPSSNPVKTKTS